MDLKTTYNIKDVISFHPFGEEKYKAIGVIEAISIFVSPKSKNVRYEVLYNKELWDIDEENIIHKERKL